MSILLRHDQDAIATLTLNAPERLNALSDEMLDAIQSQVDELMTDRSIRVVILTGSGKAFCAGHDLKQMTAAREANDHGAAYFKDLFDRCAHMMQSLQNLPQPVIAQVHGIATAAGCQLVASCDLAIADDACKFGVNGVNIGLFCSTPMVALSRNIPRKRAFEMLTTGRFISAIEAVEVGLINNCTPIDQLEIDTMALASKIAEKLGSAVKIGKQAFYEQLQLPLARAYEFTGDVMVENMLNPDTAEGIDAFLNKHAPEWDQ